MPLAPQNVSSVPGADFLELNWDRPADGTIVGFRVRWGYESGNYTEFVDLGDVNTYRIVLPFNRSTYAVVQSFNGSIPTVYSEYSPEQKRVFDIASPLAIIATPNPLSPVGGINDLFWIRPNDINLRGSRIYRTDNSVTPFNLDLQLILSGGTDFSALTLYYAVAWHPDTISAPYIDPSLIVDGGPMGLYWRSEIVSIESNLGPNWGVRATFDSVTGTPVSGQGTYVLLRALKPDFSDATAVAQLQPGAPAAQFIINDTPIGGAAPGDQIPDLFPPRIYSLDSSYSAYSDSVTNGVRYAYFVRSFDFSDSPLTGGEEVAFDGTSNTVNLTGHGFIDGDTVVFDDLNFSLPALVYAGVKYFVRDATFNSFKVAITESGTALDLEDGTGVLVQDESLLSGAVSNSVLAQQLLGSSRPAIISGVIGDNLGTSIPLSWDRSPESNIKYYEIRWATSVEGLETNPFKVNVGLVTSYLLDGFTPVDNVYVQVFAVDDGITETGATRDVTFTDTTNRVELIGHNFQDGDTVSFSSIVDTSGITEDTTYFIVDSTVDTFRLSDTKGGFTVDLVTDGTGVLHFHSLPSDTKVRLVEQSNISKFFVSRVDEGHEATFNWSNVQNVDYFQVDIDVSPSFDTVNKVSIERYLNVEDLVLISSQQNLPVPRNRDVSWYWRVRPVYPGAVFGLWSNEIRVHTNLYGSVAVTLGVGSGGLRLTNVPYDAEFLEESITVKSLDGTISYVLGLDWEFLAPNQIRRISSGAIPDGGEVAIRAQFIDHFIVGESRRIQSRDRMSNTLNPYCYDTSSRTTNIFKWFDAVAKGGMSLYLRDQGKLKQGRFIDKTASDELYERWGGMVDLEAGEVPVPDAYAAMSALVPAFLEAGTKGAIERACRGLTGFSCNIQQFGTGAGSGWIIYGDVGPPPGYPEFLFSDFEESYSVPVNHYPIILTEFDDVFNYKITVRNSARGVQRQVVRLGGLVDILSEGDIVDGSVKVIDAGDNLVDSSRYVVDHLAGTLTWVEGQEIPEGQIYTAIFAVYFTDLLKRIFNLLLPAHVNPIYDFQVTNISETLGLLVWGDGLWDTLEWGD